MIAWIQSYPKGDLRSANSPKKLHLWFALFPASTEYRIASEDVTKLFTQQAPST